MTGWWSPERGLIPDPFGCHFGTAYHSSGSKRSECWWHFGSLELWWYNSGDGWKCGYLFLADSLTRTCGWRGEYIVKPCNAFGHVGRFALNGINIVTKAGEVWNCCVPQHVYKWRRVMEVGIPDWVILSSRELLYIRGPVMASWLRPIAQEK